jgi:MFS superfamily sulfate permease-like transporter
LTIILIRKRIISNYSDKQEKIRKMTARKKSGEVLLKAERDFTYSIAEKMCSELRSALKRPAMAKVDLKDIVSIDLSSIQMIISAKRSFEKKGIPFHIKFTCSKETGILLGNSGFRNFPECEPVS